MNIDAIVKIKRCAKVSAFAAFKHWALGVRCWMLDVGCLLIQCPSSVSFIRRWALGVRRLLVQYPASSSRSGIALVMVLGILSVMVLMAVAFAIAMRTERVAAGNYADSVRARQLVQVGLARALNDLAVKLGTNGLGSTAGGTNYPPWAVTNSYTNSYTNTSTNAYLLKLLATNRANEASNFVPRVLWAAATNADNQNASNHWLPVDSLIYTNLPTVGPPAESNRMGRVKYLILNCSGLLDANFAGGRQGLSPVPRSMGTNPNEIAILNLAEIGTTTNAYSFVTNREHQVRYETLHELKELNPFLYSAGVYPSNLFVYSHALPGYWNTIPPGVGTQVNLSGSVTNLINRASDITNAFAHADFSQFESGVLYSNLIDYVDYDSIPSNFEYCVESVPMINEIVVSNELTVADAGSGTKTYSGKTDVLIECWYPFVVGAVLSFDLESAVDFSTGNIQPLNINHPPPTDSLGVPSAGSFKVIKLSTTLVPTTVATIPTVNIISKITLKVKSGADIVDQVISITITNTHDGGTDATTPSVSSMECLDPRFNLDGASTNQWRPESPSYTLYGYASSDGTNTWTKQYFSAFTTNCDNDGSMYVANHTLRSVAELGYLVYSTNAPWHTVKLYGPNLHRVLDVFGLSTNISDALMTNTVYRGLVNCNSNSAQDATAVVFADMPVDQYPDGSHSNTVMAGATVLVSRVYAGGFCTNLSDMGRNLNPSDLPGATEFERESYFRNSVNLLNVRQNLFTIIIEAQVASGGNIPRNPVRQRAVALVWRDPYTGEMFVRSIKWLRD